MNISEIQNTLDQLKERHPNLNEELVDTLLEAGSWGKNEIKEAKMLFKLNNETLSLPHSDEVFLPENTEVLLPDQKHLSGDSFLGVVKENAEENKVKENSKINSVIEKLIPNNLPLKPFESSPHVWQFSKYKDVFYGNDHIEEKNIEASMFDADKKNEEHSTKKGITLQEEIKTEEIPGDIPNISLTKVPLTKKDEGIVVVGGMLVLVVILLILYMYSQGRF